MNERLFPLSVENNLGIKVQDAFFFSLFLLITLRSKLIEFINSVYSILCVYIYIYKASGEEEKRGGGGKKRISGGSVIKDTRDNICEKDRNR